MNRENYFRISEEDVQDLFLATEKTMEKSNGDLTSSVSMKAKILTEWIDMKKSYESSFGKENVKWIEDGVNNMIRYYRRENENIYGGDWEETNIKKYHMLMRYETRLGSRNDTIEKILYNEELDNLEESSISSYINIVCKNNEEELHSSKKEVIGYITNDDGKIKDVIFYKSY